MEFAQDIKDLQAKGFKLRGTAILAELLPQQETKTASGIILQAPSDHVKGNSINAHRLVEAVVLATGPGDWDTEKREYIPMDIEPGQVIIMNQYSYSLVSVMPGMAKPLANKLVLVPTSGILASYPSQEAYGQTV